MTWTETHRRWQAMRAIEQELATASSPTLVWREEYAELFGDPAGLLAALRYRWNLAVNTQLDTHLPEAVLEEQRQQLALRARGVLRLLRSGLDNDLDAGLDSAAESGEGVSRVA